MQLLHVQGRVRSHRCGRAWGRRETAGGAVVFPAVSKPWEAREDWEVEPGVPPLAAARRTGFRSWRRKHRLTYRPQSGALYLHVLTRGVMGGATARSGCSPLRVP